MTALPTFGFDWFTPSGAPRIWSRVLAPLVGKPCHALEIGCFEGRATVWLLENILTHPDSRITVIDTFKGSMEHEESGVSFEGVEERFRANTAQFGAKVKVHIGKSCEIMPSLCHERYDLAYVDGSHVAMDVAGDACASWYLLNRGGFLIFDDYAWDRYADPALNPRLAVDGFLAAYAHELEVVHKDYQVIVRKL